MKPINFKIHITNREDKIRFQNILVNLGYSWSGFGKKIIEYIDNENFVVSSCNREYRIDGNIHSVIPFIIFTTFNFHEVPFKEITYHQFLKLTGNTFKFGRNDRF